MCVGVCVYLYMYTQVLCECLVNKGAKVSKYRWMIYITYICIFALICVKSHIGIEKSASRLHEQNQQQQRQLDHFPSLSFERSWSSIFARATWLLDKLQLLFNAPNCAFLFKYVRGRLCKWVRFLREHWHNFTHSPTTMHTHTHTHLHVYMYLYTLWPASNAKWI